MTRIAQRLCAGPLVVLILAGVVGMTVTPAYGADGAFKPTWESLNSRTCPSWFVEAKFGIFIHWGVYSVPSWSVKGSYSEWYWHWIRENSYGGKVREFHNRVYGEDFKYKQFAPRFTCELFDPDEWATIFRKSGARYVVLTSKHHDGYCLWPAPHSPGWNSMEVGPKRDLCGDLAQAVRDKGLKMGYYYSLYEWYHPLYRKDVKQYVDEHMMPQLKDLVKRHKPALIFSDGEWHHPWQTWRSTEFLAWLFNEGPNRDEVVVNDRWGKGMRHHCGDYYTTEYEGTGGPGGTWHPWEENRGIGKSFGYNRNENIFDYSSRTDCIRMLIEIVGNGGNLLLDIGPTADGRIPVIMQDRLMAIGKWLDVNGEAIYGTTAGPWRRKPDWGRATKKATQLFLHVFDWPSDDKLVVPRLVTKVNKAWLLADASKRALPVSATDDRDVTIDLAGHCPRPHATVIVLDLDGEPEVDERILPAADGSLMLHANLAVLHGRDIRVERENVEGGNIGYWTHPRASVTWPCVTVKPGTYRVLLRYACEKGSEGTTFQVAVGAATLKGKIAKPTGSWTDYQTLDVGTVKVEQGGAVDVSVKPIRKPGQAVMNLRHLKLVPAK